MNLLLKLRHSWCHHFILILRMSILNKLAQNEHATTPKRINFKREQTFHSTLRPHIHINIQSLSMIMFITLRLYQDARFDKYSNKISLSVTTSGSKCKLFIIIIFPPWFCNDWADSLVTQRSEKCSEN